MPTLSSFKRYLDSNFSAVPKVFFEGQIYHARLRCSSLNAHLFSLNIIDSHACLCGAFEDT